MLMGGMRSVAECAESSIFPYAIRGFVGLHFIVNAVLDGAHSFFVEICMRSSRRNAITIQIGAF